MEKDNFIKIPNDIGIVYRQDLPFLMEDTEWIYDKNSFTLEDLVDKNPNQTYIEDNEVYVSKELIEKLSQDKDYIFVKFDYLNNNHEYFNDYYLNEELKITDEYLVKLTKSLIEEEFDRLADISEDLIVYLLEHNPNIKDSLDFLLVDIQLKNFTVTWIEIIRPTLANKLKITETEIDISYFNKYFRPEIDFRNNLYEPYKEMSENIINLNKKIENKIKEKFNTLDKYIPDPYEAVASITIKISKEMTFNQLIELLNVDVKSLHFVDDFIIKKEFVRGYLLNNKKNINNLQQNYLIDVIEQISDLLDFEKKEIVKIINEELLSEQNHNNKLTFYHGTDAEIKKLEPKYMFQNTDSTIAAIGVGTYFTNNPNTARGYARDNANENQSVGKIYKTEVDLNKFRKATSLLKDNQDIFTLDKMINFLNGLKKEYLENFYYLITDYGIEILEPEDIEEWHIEILAEMLLDEEIRNFQIIITQALGDEALNDISRLWVENFNIDGTYTEFEENDNGLKEIHVCIINSNYEIILDKKIEKDISQNENKIDTTNDESTKLTNILNMLNTSFNATNGGIKLEQDDTNTIFLTTEFNLDNEEFDVLEQKESKMDAYYLYLDNENKDNVQLYVPMENTYFNSEGIASLFLNYLIDMPNIELNGKIYKEDIEELLENTQFINTLKEYAELKNKDEILNEIDKGLKKVLIEFNSLYNKATKFINNEFDKNKEKRDLTQNENNLDNIGR